MSDPRFYVASLTDYNAGPLHGTWITLDGTLTLDDITQQVDDMLAKSPTANKYGDKAEEWAIHDYENFPWRLSEWENFETLIAYQDALQEHDPEALNTWIECNDDAGIAIESFEDAYMGSIEGSPGDWCAEQFEETWSAILTYIGPSSMHYVDMLEKYTRYIDWDAYARDLGYEGAYFATIGDTTHVFAP